MTAGEGKRTVGGRWLQLLPVVVLGLVLLTPPRATQSNQPQQKPPDSLSAQEFSRLIRDISEEGGYFFSDNLISNETPYLTVLDKLRQLGTTGGAYIGVGPEQNFTYIAKLRPRIAFILDIRRQAVIQHLMYKALFQLSPGRPQFLSRWLSKPLTKDAPSPDASITELLTYFNKTPADDQTYAQGLAAIRKAIQEEFQFPLAQRDQSSLEYVYKSFRDSGLETSFRLNGWSDGEFPTLSEVLLQHDQHGNPGNFLASRDDYDFVRGLHMKNLIIPVVGDFGGKKALVTIGDYLRKSGLTVTAFYTSNVEQYLFEDGLFTAFANNVRKLPISESSLFIRWVYQRYYHPARMAGQRSTSLLQRMNIFLTDYDAGRYQSYTDVISTNYIAPDKSN
ncbi:MAG: hypothetical protein DMF60_21600 [Acidobacteria bacterium]|nr:MAG: hypothetical protein DMF60_21600 [Acidobacteriota bacterium]